MVRKKRAWNMSNPLYRYLHGKKKRSRSVKRAKVNVMARRYRGFRRRSRSKGGFGMGRLFSMKNILFTVAGAALLPKFVGIDPAIGGAAGGFLGAGPIGAVAGYFLGAPVANATSGLLGNLGGSAPSDPNGAAF